MPKQDKNGNSIPDYDSCDSISAYEQEYINWANGISMAKFCKDKNITYVQGETEQLYITEQAINPNKFYIVTNDNGNYYFYDGGDKDIRKSLRSQKSEMSSRKRNMRWQSGLKDLHDTLDAGKAEIYGKAKYTDEQQAEFKAVAEADKNKTLTKEQKDEKIKALNEKYGTSLTVDSTPKEIEKASKQTEGGFVNNFTKELKNAYSLMEGRYIQSEDSRTALQAIIDGKNNGSLDAQKANDEIYKWNQTYGKEQGIEINGKATVKDIEKVMNKKNGITSITGEDVVNTIKEVGNLSSVWNNSNDSIIKKFTEKGIDGDTMWGVITGKYNKDDKARKELEKFQEKITEGKLTEEEKKKEVERLNKEYSLNLSNDVTAEQIAEVVSSNKEMNYKHTVTQIAEKIIEDKLNEQLNKVLEEKLGGKLKKYGINFSFEGRNTIKEIIDIVRGQKYIKIDQAKFLEGLQKTLEDKIDKLIVQKADKYIDKYAKKINEKIDSVTKKITSKLDTYRKKVDDFAEKLTKWGGEEGKIEIANKLNSLISAPVDKITNILNMPDKFLGKIGLNLGLGNMFKQITQVYTKGIVEKIQTTFKPVLEKALAITKKVSETIKNVIAKVNELRDKAKQLIEKWKEQIKDQVKKVTQKLVNEITKYVKLNLSGLGGGIKI